MTHHHQEQMMRRLQAANPFPAPTHAAEAPDASRFLDQLDTRSSRVRWRVRRGGLAAVAALAFAVIGAFLLTSRGGDSDAQAAAKVLRQAATNVSGGDAVLKPGQFFYTRVVVSFPSAAKPNCLVERTALQETWLALDGTGWVRGALPPAHFSSASERRACLAGGVPGQFEGRRFNGPLEGSTDPLLGPPIISYDDFRALPVDVSGLSRAVARLAAASQGGTATPVATLGVVSDLLEAWPASARLRASLLKVAANTPGLHLVGNTTDPVGRAGVAVEARLEAGGASFAVQLIVDPGSGELLARRLVTTHGGSSTTESTTWTRSAVVASAPSGG
jgi:hypothetical protein